MENKLVEKFSKELQELIKKYNQLKKDYDWLNEILKLAVAVKGELPYVNPDKKDDEFNEFWKNVELRFYRGEIQLYVEFIDGDGLKRGRPITKEELLKYFSECRIDNEKLRI